jgi:hypothetical protein
MSTTADNLASHFFSAEIQAVNTIGAFLRFEPQDAGCLEKNITEEYARCLALKLAEQKIVRFSSPTRKKLVLEPIALKFLTTLGVPVNIFGVSNLMRRKHNNLLAIPLVKRQKKSFHQTEEIVSWLNSVSEYDTVNLASIKADICQVIEEYRAEFLSLIQQQHASANNILAPQKQQQ